MLASQKLDSEYAFGVKNIKNCIIDQRMVFQTWTLRNKIDSQNCFQDTIAFVGIFKFCEKLRNILFFRTLLLSMEFMTAQVFPTSSWFISGPHKKPFSSMELIFAAKTTPPLH